MGLHSGLNGMSMTETSIGLGQRRRRGLGALEPIR